MDYLFTLPHKKQYIHIPSAPKALAFYQYHVTALWAALQGSALGPLPTQPLCEIRGECLCPHSDNIYFMVNGLIH